MLIDLHTHTRPISWDSDLTPDQLIDLSKAAGLDGVCFTEHDYFWDGAECRALAERHDFLVLPGVEVNTEDGHLLVFGLQKYQYGMHRIEQLTSMVDAAGGAMIAAHPYRRYMPWYHLDEPDLEKALSRALANPAYKHCVALEAWHGRAAPQQNAFSQRLCERLEMRASGGSDAHQPPHVARCATRFERPVRTLEELIAELKAGRFQGVDLRSGDEQ
jgi:predicted metal-dependent phosphoesterase TrpH